MVANIANAAAAYANSAAKLGVGGLAPRDGQTPSFGDMLAKATDQAVAIQHKGEQMSAAAVVGKADLTDVVSAVTNAEVTLQTVMAVRDKVVNAYQEIMRMPI